MGAQISNTLTGQTSGTIITVDYTTDFQQLSTDIQSLVNAVTTLNNTLATTMATADLSFNAALSPTAGVTPGTIGAALGALTRVTDAQSTAAQNSSDNLAAIGAALTGQSDNAVSQIGSSLAVLNATAQIFVAQQNKKAEFEKAVTQAALKRSNLPEVEVKQPDVDDAIKQSVTDAGQISLQASATGFITTQVGKGVEFASDLALDYVQDTALYASAKAKFDALKASISGNTGTGEKAETDAKQVLADTKVNSSIT